MTGFMALALAGGVPADTTPDQYTLTDTTNVIPGSTQTSNTITPTGYNAQITVTLSGDASSQIQKNGGAWGAGPITLDNPGVDNFAVRHTASANSATAVNTVVTATGGITDTFTSTTRAATVLDGTNKVANWTLSNGNLTGTHAASGGPYEIVRGTNGFDASQAGDRWFDVVYSGGQPQIGLCNASAATSGEYPGSSTHGISVEGGTTFIYMGSSTPIGTATTASFAAGDTVRIRLKNGKFYAAKNGTYILGNPTAETGGIDVSPLGVLFPALAYVGAQNATFDFTGWK